MFATTSLAEQRFDRCLAFDQHVAQLSSASVPSSDDVFEGDRLTCELRIDGATHELVVEVDPHLGHVAWVIADDDVLPDIRR